MCMHLPPSLQEWNFKLHQTEALRNPKPCTADGGTQAMSHQHVEASSTAQVCADEVPWRIFETANLDVLKLDPCQSIPIRICWEILIDYLYLIQDDSSNQLKFIP